MCTRPDQYVRLISILWCAVRVAEEQEAVVIRTASEWCFGETGQQLVMNPRPRETRLKRLSRGALQQRWNGILTLRLFSGKVPRAIPHTHGCVAEVASPSVVMMLLSTCDV
jgi:hypothetical protein